MKPTAPWCLQTQSSINVISFLVGHQGKQHHHVGGPGESMREYQVAENAEESDPHYFIHNVSSLTKELLVFDLHDHFDFLFFWVAYICNKWFSLLFVFVYSIYRVLPLQQRLLAQHDMAVLQQDYQKIAGFQQLRWIQQWVLQKCCDLQS